MKIAMSGRRAVTGHMIHLGKILEKYGHSYTIPEYTDNGKHVDKETWIKRLLEADCLLVINMPKKQIPYVGEDTNKDISIMYLLEKPVFMYFKNTVPITFNMHMNVHECDGNLDEFHPNRSIMRLLDLLLPEDRKVVADLLFF